MNHKRDSLVPISDSLSELDGHVPTIRDASPQARHHFTRFDPVNQLVSASETDPESDQRGHLNRMLRLALPFFVDATFCVQTLAQMRRHPEFAVWVGDSCLHEPHRRSSRDRSGSP